MLASVLFVLAYISGGPSKQERKKKYIGNELKGRSGLCGDNVKEIANRNTRRGIYSTIVLLY